MPSLNLDQAFRYLIDAPQIVKALAPMSWSYVQAPQDGTLWLEWLPPEKTENNRFPSDGYVWGDGEATFRQDFGGYTVEMLVHNIGYRMQYDHMASHARTRYHFVSKNPSVNAAPPDPSLWIVHYHQAEHTRILPSSQVPFTPQMQQVMSERRWLESQGMLEKKDFMLHDRSSWPMIEVPRRAGMPGRQMQQPGFYGANVQQNRYPQYFPQQAGQPPQSKRQKMNPPVPGTTTDGVHDTSIEDEENTTLGDFFDHLTPRDISMTRYMQHHRWMEEVFSSPYPSAQIVPTDLGLGLMGELKGLTEGILELPSTDSTGDKPEAPKSKETAAYTNLKKEQIDEFNKRAEKHLEEGQAEIERMKAEHAAKMAEWKKSTKTLLQAEQRLRHATWEGHEDAVPTFRFEDTAVDGHAEEGAKKETVEDIIKEVESSLGVKIRSHKDANMIEKGGLEKEEEQPREQMVQSQQRNVLGQPQQASNAANGGMAQGQVYHSDPLAATMQNKSPMPQSAPQSSFQGSHQQQQQQQAQQQSAQAPQQLSAGMSTMGVDDTSMEGMEFDMNEPTFSFDDSQLDAGVDEATGAGVPSGEVTAQASGVPNSDARSTPGTMAQAAGSAAFGGPAGPTTSVQQQASMIPAGGESNLGQNNVAGSDNNSFDDQNNFESYGDGNDLLDFGDGGMEDDSMFGEALHGMDAGEEEGAQ